ncbi:MAG: hypothetical protein V2B14_00065 [bacterium]
MMKIFIIIFLFIALSLSCVANELYKADDSNNVHKTLLEMEKQIYQRDYSAEDVFSRIERLENTIYKAKQHSSFFERLKQLKKSISFAEDQKSSINQQIILDLLENKYFGISNDNSAVEERLAKLEKNVFGKSLTGDINYRFALLSEKIPLNITGISIVNGFKEKILYKPGTNKQYSALSELKHSNLEDNYFENIRKSYNNRILRWKDFPIYVYIDETSGYEKIKSAQKAVQVWNEYIHLNLINNKQNANIIISWDGYGNNVSEPILAYYDNEVCYQVLIHANYCRDIPVLNKFLIHQIGHALGIWGHSNNSKDIMYDFTELKSDINCKSNDSSDISINFAPDKPSERDINTLIKIYNLPSVIDEVNNTSN